MAGILLVDDSDELRMMLVSILEESGHEVQAFDNGKAASKALQRRHFDLVITDIVMPDKEGLELIREIRRDDPNAKIIAMSGSGDGLVNYLHMANKFGAQRTLSKPFSADAFREAVRAVLGSETSTSANSTRA